MRESRRAREKVCNAVLCLILRPYLFFISSIPQPSYSTLTRLQYRYLQKNIQKVGSQISMPRSCISSLHTPCPKAHHKPFESTYQFSGEERKTSLQLGQPEIFTIWCPHCRTRIAWPSGYATALRPSSTQACHVLRRRGYGWVDSAGAKGVCAWLRWLVLFIFL
ncbi:hypothetical protein DM02DRAFT_396171 [Periconia macrospinosa]|uniref:Uncharacterized protein n=1 Tax=Periconia macrospinosa TaxID=97972 RepID=A0A2V1DSU1_9PLEO|nr:hypothetical protein DM02DRAFT_396171 [Periconia macrospinosa]